MPKFDRFLSVSLCLFAVCSFAQDEIPTRVSAQNRSGDLPFSATVGLWATNMPRVSYASYTKICNTNDPDAPNHVFPGHVVGVGSYIYHDASGAKHPLSVSYEEAECEMGSYVINNSRGPALSGAG